MKHFVVALVTILLHKAITETFSVSYDLFSAPFEASRLLVDLALFAAIYLVVSLALRGWSSVGEASREVGGEASREVGSEASEEDDPNPR